MPTQKQKNINWEKWCVNRLIEHEKRNNQDPTANSVRQLAYELYQQVETGTLNIEQLAQIGQSLSKKSLINRAQWAQKLRNQKGKNGAVTTKKIATMFDTMSFDTLRRQLEKPQAGIVFTAHPTFAMNAKTAAATADYISGNPRKIRAISRQGNDSVTLDDEHQLTQNAIARTQQALRDINRNILINARRKFPNQWKNLKPRPLSVASWVGYDLDGRTDIQWYHTLKLRLEEKATQLNDYAKQLKAINLGKQNTERDTLVKKLTNAASLAHEQAAHFTDDTIKSDAISQAANKLTEKDSRRLISLKPIITSINRIIAQCNDHNAVLSLSIVRSDMLNYGLGISNIHLRINATQVYSALRNEFNLSDGIDFDKRTTLRKIAKKLANVKTVQINTASIFNEQMTARRQLKLCAQFFKHVDADAPVRFLIAECESPATIIGTLYLARLYGVDHQIDISPLFETPDALERGGRLIGQMLAEDDYKKYIRKRGRIAVQIGFSDSGRYMGQVSANLAIERLHMLVARELVNHDVRDTEIVMFNTHGESMGRGAFPGTLKQRFDYLMTPWTRHHYQKQKLKLNFESSFQGADGFIHFGTDQLAKQTLMELIYWRLSPTQANMNDGFYSDTNFSWDFFRNLKQWQEDTIGSKNYQTAISTFAPGFLVIAGSRQTRRQSGAAMTAIQSLRAIPNNAILQQLAIPLHIFGGIGTITGTETDHLIDQIKNSDRMQQIMHLVGEARKVTSLPVFRAYAGIFDPSFWIAQAANTDNQKHVPHYAEIATRLETVKIPHSMNQLSNQLTVDLIRLDDILIGYYGKKYDLQRYDSRRTLHSLHAVRMAMIMCAFIRIASLPLFSSKHDVSRKAIFDLAFRIEFDNLATMLEEIFPNTGDDISDAKLITENSNEINDSPHGYPEIHANIIEQLRIINQAVNETSIGISHYYGAYG